MSWEDIQLGDFLTLKRGYDLPSSDRKEGDIPIVSSSGITGHHNVAKVAAPGVVTGRYGTLGEVFYVQEDFWPLNTALYVQDFKGNNERFTAYFLKGVLKGTGSDKAAVPGVNRNDLHARKVRVTRSLAQQSAIASVLSAYDDLIENNRRRIALLEQAARLLYKEWFVHLRFPGHEHVKLVESSVGQIPADWHVDSLENVCEFIVDSEHKTAPTEAVGIPMIRTPDIAKGYLLINNARRVSQHTFEAWTRRAVPAQGDLILAREAPVGNVGIVPPGQPVCLGQRTVLLRANPGIVNPHVLLRILLSDFCQNAFTGASSGVTVAHLNLRDLRRLAIPVPSSNLQLEASDVFMAIDKQIAKLYRHTAALTQARDLLLPRLMNGEIPV